MYRNYRIHCGNLQDVFSSTRQTRHLHDKKDKSNRSMREPSQLIYSPGQTSVKLEEVSPFRPHHKILQDPTNSIMDKL